MYAMIDEERRYSLSAYYYHSAHGYLLNDFPIPD